MYTVIFYFCEFTFKGALDDILKFYFWLNFIESCKMQLLIYEYKKKNSKIPSEN